MKKTNKATAPSKAKAPVKKDKDQVDAVLDMLNNMDDDLIAMLRATMQNELSFSSEMFGCVCVENLVHVDMATKSAKLAK